MDIFLLITPGKPTRPQLIVLGMIKLPFIVDACARGHTSPSRLWFLDGCIIQEVD